MKTSLNFGLRVGHYDDRAPTLVISVNDVVVKQLANISVDWLESDIEVNLPCVINLTVTGRQPNDTVLDDTGKISKDVFIELQHVKIHDINYCKIPGWALPDSHAGFCDENEIPATNKTFWNRNGTFTLNIDQDDVLLWFLSHRCLVFNSSL
jgi:hypothetical protein